MCYVLQCCGHQACTYVRCLHESHVNKKSIIIIMSPCHGRMLVDVCVPSVLQEHYVAKRSSKIGGQYPSENKGKMHITMTREIS